jgi:tetratricopeptide (TPR) repeat protein
MSPEQAAGEATIDGRSDLYSLGLVAYEMIAGRPVVTAETPASILAKHLTEEPTPLRTLSTDVPDPLDTAIRESLRKRPEERYARGRMVAAVLEGRDPGDITGSGSRTLAANRFANSTPRRRPLLKWGVLGAAVTALLVVVGLQLGGGDDRTPTPQNTNTWLIAPFELQTGNSSLEWLRDGAVNMLGLTLSQWNDLSVVDYERTLDLLRNVREDDARRISLEDARRIARRASAGTVVMGQITSANDSLFLVARLYDVATGARIDTATAGAPIDSDPRVAFDRIARGLLDIMNGPAISVELTRQTTESVEAYRLYLEGLRALNRWRTDEADTLFAQAIAIDSTFALAYYKRSLGLGWQNITDSLYLRSAELAVQHGNRLPPRSREVVAGNADLARGFMALGVGDLSSARARWAEARTRLAAVIQEDSTDTDAWYGVADADFHSAFNTGMTDADSVALMLTRSMRGFRRAIALDSSFHLAYQHLVDLYQMGANPRAMIVIDGDTIRTTASVGDSTEVTRLRTVSQDLTRQFAIGWLEQEPDGAQAWTAVLNTYNVLQQFDSAIALINRARERPSVYSANLAFTLPLFHVITGNPDSARRELLDAVTRFDPDSLGVRTVNPAQIVPFPGMTVAGATGSLALLDSITKLVAASGDIVPIMNMPTRPTAEWFAAGVRLGMGVTASPAVVRTIRGGITALEGSGPTGAQIRRTAVGVPYAAYLATRDSSFAEVARRWATVNGRIIELDASVALDRGDTTAARAAVAQFPAPERIRTAALTGASIRVLTQADVRARLGDVRGALQTYEALTPSNFSVGLAEPGAALYVRSLLRRGALYEQVGDRDAAMRSYAEFVRWWSGADAALQGEVREAQAALTRLRDQVPRREVPGKG